MSLQDWVDRCHFLEERCVHLQKKIHQLEYQLGIVKMPVIPGFTPTEMKIISTLLHSNVAHRSIIMAAVYYGEKPKPKSKVIDVHMCEIRRKLKVYSVEIRTLYRYGYLMHEEDKKKVNALLA